MSYEEYLLAGRNAVLEALRAGKPIDKSIFWTDARTDPSGRSSGRQRRQTQF